MELFIFQLRVKKWKVKNSKWKLLIFQLRVNNSNVKKLKFNFRGSNSEWNCSALRSWITLKKNFCKNFWVNNLKCDVIFCNSILFRTSFDSICPKIYLPQKCIWIFIEVKSNFWVLITNESLIFHHAFYNIYVDIRWIYVLMIIWCIVSPILSKVMGKKKIISDRYIIYLKYDFIPHFLQQGPLVLQFWIFKV